jgi:hypothetical protein
VSVGRERLCCVLEKEDSSECSRRKIIVSVGGGRSVVCWKRKIAVSVLGRRLQ